MPGGLVAPPPVPSTGPTQRSPTRVKSLRKRVETNENNVKRLQANRQQQPVLMHQLANAGPMSRVQDGQVAVYDAASGTYVPTDLPLGHYASLTGPGETASPGALTQDGDFEIDGSFLVQASTGSEAIALNSKNSISLTVNPGGGGNPAQIVLNTGDIGFALTGSGFPNADFSHTGFVFNGPNTAPNHLVMGLDNGPSGTNNRWGVYNDNMGSSNFAIEVIESGFLAVPNMGFFGAAPVAQAGAITPPTGGTTVDTQARSAIGDIITALKGIGITA